MRNLLIILIGIIALCASSCGGHKVITVDVPKVQKEYVYQRDTLIKEDSIYIFNDRFTKNDTVYVTKVNEKFKYVYKNRVDTLVKIDTITIVDESKIVEQQEQIDALTQVMNYYRILGMMLIGLVVCTTIMYLFKK